MTVLRERKAAKVADVVDALQPPLLAYTTVLSTMRTLVRIPFVIERGSLLLSPIALGGFAFVLFSIALALGLFAPAAAFSPQAHVAQVAAASNCSREVAVAKEARPSESLPAGQVVVDVTVSSTGAVTGAKIAHSSGNAKLDRAVMKLAKTSTYEPAMRNCKPVAGAYQFMFVNG